MKFFVALALAVLVASAQAQQMVTLNTCISNTGTGTSAIAQYYVSPNSQNKDLILTNVNTVFNNCNAALNNPTVSLEAGVNCDAILAQVRTAKAYELAKIHTQYSACVKSL